ncbi:AI-2E family transporter [Otariodibacter sp.]|uniref:AI-2E family transporter n=1 Tax=Otariodibacter sp. TaxID=3030919 RepID=UPI00260F1DB7|nr:AI-2E family transporter [Otariodibacter sp.]
MIKTNILKHTPWFLLLLIGILFFYFTRSILTPFLISGVLAYFFSPLIDKLEARNISRAKSLLIAYTIIILLLILSIIFIVPIVNEQMREFQHIKPQIIHFFQYDFWHYLNNWIPFDLNIDADTVEKAIKDTVKNTSEEGDNSLTQSVFDSASWVISFITNLALVPIITYYFLKNYHTIIDNIFRLIPKRNRATIIKIAKESDKNLSAFLRGQFIVMNILAAIYIVSLTTMGLSYSLLIGLVAGYLNFIPFIGLWVGACTAILVSIFQFGDILHIVIVVAIFTVAQIIEGNFLTPKLVGDRIGLGPVTVIFAVMAGGELLGIMGVLIALPLSAVLKVILEHIRESYEESEFYENNSKLIIPDDINENIPHEK